MQFANKKIQKLKLLGTYVSINSDRNYKGDDYFVTKQVLELNLTTEGIVGDRHFGYTTISGGRFKTLYQRGIEVRNNRQWSAISPYEVNEISKNLSIEGGLTPELMGINFLIEGINDITKIPRGNYLIFSQHEDFKPGRNEDVVLVVYGEALPCKIAGKALVKPLEDITLESKFPKNALNLRGTTGWVEKGGIIRPGYSVWSLSPTGQD